MSGSEVFEVVADISEPDLSVVAVTGEIDMVSAPELERRLAEVIRRGVPVVVDLSEVTFIDSSGLRELHRASDLGRLMVVIQQDAPVAGVVSLSGFGEIVSVFGDLDTAKGCVRGGA
jgi:anti-sigma B factor antagonist